MIRRGYMRALRRLLAGFDPEGRAQERSLELLLQHLSPAQRTEFKRSKAFRVCGQSGQQYRITYGNAGNVEALTPAGAVSRRLCAGPLELPIPAVMLAQKLMLETQESEFLRIAALGPGTTGERGFAHFAHFNG